MRQLGAIRSRETVAAGPGASGAGKALALAAGAGAYLAGRRGAGTVEPDRGPADRASARLGI